MGSAELATPASVADSPLKPYKYNPKARIVPTTITTLIKKTNSPISAIVVGGVNCTSDPIPNGKAASPPNKNPQDRTHREPYLRTHRFEPRE